MRYVVVKCLNQRCAHDFLTIDQFAHQTQNCPRCNSEQIQIQKPKSDPSYRPIPSLKNTGSREAKHIDNTLQNASLAFGMSDMSNKGGTPAKKFDTPAPIDVSGTTFKTPYGALKPGWSGIRPGTSKKFQAQG